MSIQCQLSDLFRTWPLGFGRIGVRITGSIALIYCRNQQVLKSALQIRTQTWKPHQRRIQICQAFPISEMFRQQVVCNPKDNTMPALSYYSTSSLDFYSYGNRFYIFSKEWLLFLNDLFPSAILSCLHLDDLTIPLYCNFAPMRIFRAPFVFSGPCTRPSDFSPLRRL